MERIINMERLEAFKVNMYLNEKSQNTISKYMHDIKLFCSYVENKEICKDLVMKFKEYLITKYSIVSANSMIAAINSFFRHFGWLDCCVKQFKVQRKVYCSDEKELTKEEYIKLVTTAKKKGNERLNLLLQTVCGRGIRVSELKYITVESVKKGEAEVSCKGKVRVIFIVKELKRSCLAMQLSKELSLVKFLLLRMVNLLIVAIYGAK
jgi:site-specific recombinase XerD